jgi:hypothetical protein
MKKELCIIGLIIIALILTVVLTAEVSDEKPEAPPAVIHVS